MITVKELFEKDNPLDYVDEDSKYIFFNFIKNDIFPEILETKDLKEFINEKINYLKMIENEIIIYKLV